MFQSRKLYTFLALSLVLLCLHLKLSSQNSFEILQERQRPPPERNHMNYRTLASSNANLNSQNNNSDSSNSTNSSSNSGNKTTTGRRSGNSSTSTNDTTAQNSTTSQNQSTQNSTQNETKVNETTANQTTNVSNQSLPVENDTSTNTNSTTETTTDTNMTFEEASGDSSFNGTNSSFVLRSPANQTETAMNKTYLDDPRVNKSIISKSKQALGTVEDISAENTDAVTVNCTEGDKYHLMIQKTVNVSNSTEKKYAWMIYNSTNLRIAELEYASDAATTESTIPSIDEEGHKNNGSDNAEKKPKKVRTPTLLVNSNTLDRMTASGLKKTFALNLKCQASGETTIFAVFGDPDIIFGYSDDDDTASFFAQKSIALTVLAKST